MDQINQVPTTGATGGTPEQNKPVSTPTPTTSPSPTPLSQLPSFAPKKSNIKLWAGVIGGILIVVIGAAMILGKTKTYKGSFRFEEMPGAPSEQMAEDVEKAKEAEKIAEEEPSRPTEEELPKLVEPTPIETPEMAAPANEGLIALCNSVGGSWNSGHAGCSFNGQNYVNESSLSAAYQAKQTETASLPSAASDQMLADLEKTKQGMAMEAEKLAAQEAEAQAKVSETKEPEGPVSGSTPLGAASPESQAIADEAKQISTDKTETPEGQEHPTGSTGVVTKINETGEHFLVAQAETGALKSLCNSTPGTQWNEAGIESSCVFEGITFKNLQALKTKIDQVEAQTQADAEAQQLNAASDESQAIVTIAKMENAARSAAQDFAYIESLLDEYPSNPAILSADDKAYDAQETALDALEEAQGVTDPGILGTLLSKAELAAFKAAAAKTAAKNAYDTEKAAEAAAKATANQANQNNSGGGGSTYQEPAPPAPQTLNPSAPEQTGGGSSWSGNSGGGGGSNVIPYTGPGGGGGVKTPSIPGGTPNKKSSSEEAKLLGYLETPEMWGDSAKSSTIETPEMWGDAAPTATPIKVGAGATGGTAYGATIQGKTGPGVLLYPVFIAGANSLYYLLRKRRKNKK